MDKETRNRIQRATQAARRLLEQEFAAQLEGTFDVLPDGTIKPEPGAHLGDDERLTRAKIVAAIEHRRAGGIGKAEAVADYVREAAFTTLNRFVALKMLEARGLILESISRGERSSGFREFGALAPGLADLPDHGYRLYIECLFDELGTEIGVLFDRRDPASLLWPRRQPFDQLLAILNAPDLAEVWQEDETIGWVYQYFNGEDERRRMRAESAAPRNSRELAVRNQFFTPRYVVRFLTDNTLGRIWFEMRKGETRLAEQCEYMVRRPGEVFAREHSGQHAWIENVVRGEFAALPDPFTWDDSAELAHLIDGYGLASKKGLGELGELANRKLQEAERTGEWTGTPLELLLCLFFEHRRARHSGYSPEGKDKALLDRLCGTIRAALVAEPADRQESSCRLRFVPHRPKKDPRDLKVLDPACGSGHFLLYAFDLLQTIYEEGWEDETAPRSELTGRTLREDYPEPLELRRELPGLILRHNLHGIEIDPRCAQIAALALWMRAQRAFHDFGIPRGERPLIAKTNVVVAEPMPGEKDLLEEFLRELREDRLEALIREALAIPPERTVRATKAMANSLSDLVRAVWNGMELAGELGSLLKIELRLQHAIAEGQEEWDERLPLFRVVEYGLDGTNKEKRVRFIEGRDQDFWSKAEQLTLHGLRRYAAKQTANGRATTRRLFAEDAERGLALADLCRQRFDVVLMNPPFGAPSSGSKSTIGSVYRRTKNDLYAAFVERGIELLQPRGMLGAITSRTGFFLASFQKWREEVLLAEAPPAVFADLGYGVMDSAMVEAAAYCLEKGLGAAA